MEDRNQYLIAKDEDVLAVDATVIRCSMLHVQLPEIAIQPAACLRVCHTFVKCSFCHARDRWAAPA